MALADYTITEKICDNRTATFFRARQSETNQPVILKVLRGREPNPEQTAWFCQEYNLLKQLNLPGIITVDALQWNAQQPFVVLPDTGGQSLAAWHRNGYPTIIDFLDVALSCARILGQLHQVRIVHRDINPANFLIDPITRKVELIDLAIASQVAEASFSAAPALSAAVPAAFVDNLAYISPEQTGRMHQGVDYRTDFYSLGITLYELLNGTPPFQGDDFLELIHSHIARPAPVLDAVAQLADGEPVPAQVSAIVMKLIEKDPNARYQSAHGLIADLERCYRDVTAVDPAISGRVPPIHPFALASQDYKAELTFPTMLFGRQCESQQLLDVLDHPGQPELVLVSGEAGVGKSALVHRLKPAIATQQGLFLTGKYDQYQRNIPYHGIVQALGQFCEQLLSRERAELEQWKERLLRSIGGNYQLLADIIPQLSLVIGKHPPLVVDDLHDNANRLNLLFGRFFTAIAEAHAFVVLFLDDLHWADEASVQLLTHLIRENRLTQLRLIGSYRPQELRDVNPLVGMLEALKQQGQICEIVLQPLAVHDVNALLAQTLASELRRTEPLAELIHRKTHGNPFFVLEFIKSLYKEELLVYCLPLPHGQGAPSEPARWEWDMSRILAKNTTQNVVVLMLEEIHQLPPRTRVGLQLASCLGNCFSLATLAIAQSMSASQALQILWPSVQAGFITPLDDQYRLHLNSLFDDRPTELSGDRADVFNALQEQQTFLEKHARSAQFKFQHDRVQEAVYGEIEPKQREVFHHQIGRRLLEHQDSDDLGQPILTLVNHLNQGVGLFATTAEKIELAQLNQQAGQKASHNAAHANASTYFEQGIILCENSGMNVWASDYELALALHNGAHRAACLTGNFERQQELSHRMEAELLCWQDRLELTETKIHACNAQQQFAEAIAIAKAFVAPLGVQFPDNPGPEDFQAGLVKTLTLLQGRAPLSLLDQPTMESPEALAVLRILHNVHTALYMASPALFPLAIFQEVQLSLEHGNGPLSAPAYVYFGLILCGFIGDMENGYGFGQLAQQLAHQPGGEATRSATLLTVAAATTHWQEPIGNTLKIFQEGYRSGVKSGDFQSAAFCLQLHGIYSFMMGTPLTGVEKTLGHSVEAIAQLYQATSLQMTRAYQQIIANLADPEVECPWEITGDICHEADIIATLEQAQDYSSLGHIYINKLMLSYWFGQYDQAEAVIAMAAPFVEALPGTIMVPIYQFYAALTLLAQYPKRDEVARPQILEQVETHRDQLQAWAQAVPMTYDHKWALVEAERLRVLDRPWEAIKLYEQAIQGARKHGFLNEEAIAYEQAARFHQAHQQTDLAYYHIQQAHSVCTRWQAAAKAKQLERNDLSLSAAQAVPPSIMVSQPEVRATSSQSLDVASVLKATQALSGEMALSRLLSRLMTIVLENAGAETGCLVLLEEGEKAVFAEGTVGQGITVLTAQPRPLEPERLPLQVVNSVMRLRKSVVLHQAATAGEFTQDPYILKHQTQSILCTPLINQGHVIGLLYVENNLTPAAFNAERLEVLTLLCSQAAISIENAQLYERLKQHSISLEQKVAERTQELIDANQSLQRLATLDSLTQIANRRRFDEYLSQEYWRSQREATPLSVILCDVDHFKLYNDHYGHQAGDECLKQVAQALSQSVHRSVDLAARYGGEEFALILPNTSMKGAIAIAEAVQQNLEALKLLHEASLTHTYVSVSLGLSCSTQASDLDTPEALVELADQGLYKAKEEGRNRYAFCQTAAESLMEPNLPPNQIAI